MNFLTNLIFEPKGKHDSALAYDIKDTVMSADGRRVYVALQDVPAGIALDNAEYWIKILDVSDIQGGPSEGGAVSSVNGKTGAVVLSAEDVGALPEDTPIPDVSDFITRAVSDLLNYYTKSQTYTRDEIDQKVSAIPKFSVSVVSALPSTGISTTTIYLVPGGADDNLYTEYINVNGTWEILGSQRVDLTGYATQSWALEQLNGYQPKGNYQPAGDYALKSELPTKLSDLSEDSTHRVVTDAEKAAWSGKLDANKLPEAIDDALAQAKESGEFDGKDGQPGKNGTDGGYYEPNVDTAGNLTWTPSKDGMLSIAGRNIKGPKGNPGTSVTITEITESTADGGSNVVTFDDGKTLTVKNGKTGTPGDPGAPGDPGYTPRRGVDYYTESDKTEWSEYIAAELAKRGQLKPEFANSIEECEDESLLYVLPDGYIYGYIKTTVTTPERPDYTNVLKTAIDTDGSVFNGTGYKNGWRLNSSGVEKEAAGCGYTGFIEAKNGDVIRIKNMVPCERGYVYVQYYTAAFSRQGYYSTDDMVVVGDDGVITFTLERGDASTKYYRISNGEMTESTIITINEEIKTIPGGTTVEYRWASTGHAFVPADYEDRIVAVEKKAASNETKIATLENKPATSGDAVMYISPDGDDANNGLTASAPKKTVKSCMEAGATRISAKRGVYAEAIDLRNIGSFEIFPTDNGKTYVTGEDRHPIVFDTSDSVAVSALASYNSIKRIAYTAAANSAYDQVFVKKTLEPVVSASQSSYRAALWLFSDDEKTVCRKPKPVLTVAECEAGTNTFCYSDGYVYINADLTGVTKIVIPTITTNGFYAYRVANLVLREVEVRHSGEYTFDIRECAWVDFYKCASKYTTRASGFHPVDTDGIFRACYATKCFDGFAPNGHGHTTYIDCVSEFNYDDGMSHHAASEGTVIGGRYEGNGKGGNIPAYGAKVNIYGGLYKNNKQYGIEYAGDGSGNFACGMVQGAVMVGNPVGLEVQIECIVTALDCHYSGNTKDKNIVGTLTEY